VEVGDKEEDVMVRKPAVAGRFYHSQPKVLLREVKSCFDEGVERQKAIGVVSPHAGYVYSGRVAGEVFSRVEIPQHVIVLGPNHRGVGAKAAVYARGAWDMPLGTVPIDEELIEKIMGSSSLVDDDPRAHDFEHSLEVQLPFIQALREDFLLTPLALGSLSLAESLSLGDEIASVLQAFDEDVLLVASSDMTHYEPAESAKERDRVAIDEIINLNPEGLYDVVCSEGITMCGYIPVTIMLQAARVLGAEKAELVHYMTSGDVSGDYGSVVGYAGVIVR
jgi:AmmeMemoRadiSam system protein B